MTGPIGIIGAMDVEIELLKSKLENPVCETVSGVSFYRGRLSGKDTVLAICGIGKCFASLCAEAMILRYEPSLIINIGVAGTLTDKLTIGDLAIGSSAVCHDMDISALGDPVGLISGINLVNIPLSSELAKIFDGICQKEGISSEIGVIASGDQFICDPIKKKWIASAFGAIACEMEGQAIAQTCYVNRVPCAILRSISDSADGNAIDYLTFKQLAAEHSGRIILSFLETV